MPNLSKQQITDTDKDLGLVITFRRARTDRQTNKQTNKRTLPNVLSPLLRGWYICSILTDVISNLKLQVFPKMITDCRSAIQKDTRLSMSTMLVYSDNLQVQGFDMGRNDDLDHIIKQIYSDKWQKHGNAAIYKLHHAELTDVASSQINCLRNNRWQIIQSNLD